MPPIVDAGDVVQEHAVLAVAQRGVPDVGADQVGEHDVARRRRPENLDAVAVVARDDVAGAGLADDVAGRILDEDAVEGVGDLAVPPRSVPIELPSTRFPVEPAPRMWTPAPRLPEIRLRSAGPSRRSYCLASW